MIGAYESDLIRPLGLVTLYFAYAEGEIDELLSILNTNAPSTLNWPVGQKLSRALELVEALKLPKLAALVDTLREAQALANLRNQLVHGRLFAGGRLKSPNPKTPDVFISAEEIAQLAERIFTCKEHLFVHRCRHLLPALSRKASVAGGT